MNNLFLNTKRKYLSILYTIIFLGHLPIARASGGGIKHYFNINEDLYTLFQYRKSIKNKALITNIKDKLSQNISALFNLHNKQALKQALNGVNPSHADMAILYSLTWAYNQGKASQAVDMIGYKDDHTIADYLFKVFSYGRQSKINNKLNDIKNNLPDTMISFIKKKENNDFKTVFGYKPNEKDNAFIHSLQWAHQAGVSSISSFSQKIIIVDKEEDNENIMDIEHDTKDKETPFTALSKKDSHLEIPFSSTLHILPKKRNNFSTRHRTTMQHHIENESITRKKEATPTSFEMLSTGDNIKRGGPPTLIYVIIAGGGIFILTKTIYEKYIIDDTIKSDDQDKESDQANFIKSKREKNGI